MFVLFFFKQKTAYEMRISDWSSDVCSSDLGTVVSRSRVIDIVDKGHGRGAIVTAERLLFFNQEATPSVRLESSLFCRADGGFGGATKPGVKPHQLPERDKAFDLHVATLPQAALIYPLSSDNTELHVNPD